MRGDQDAGPPVVRLGVLQLPEQAVDALAHPEQHDQRVSPLADGLLPQPPLPLPQVLKRNSTSIVSLPSPQGQT